MGAACSVGVIQKYAEGSELKAKKKFKTVGSFGKRKKGDESERYRNSPAKSDSGELRFSFSGDLLLSTPPRKSGDPKKGSFLGKARVVGLERAVDVLDALGSGVANLNSSGFLSGKAIRGNRISVLSFEVANTITKGASLMLSLSEENVQYVKQKVFGSEGVHKLVSTDTKVLLSIAAADKREEHDTFCREVVRFGNLCKDPQWHNLDRYFAKMDSENASQTPLREDAELEMHELTTLAQHTAEVYHELNALDRFEQDYRQKREEAESLNLPIKGESFVMLQTELKHQRKLVMSLKRKSLWSKRMEEVVEKLVDICVFIHAKILEEFGNTELDEVRKEPNKFPERLGVAGLALHYANIINQIDNIASRPSFIPPNTRDSLYRGLPTYVKTALRSSLTRFDSKGETSVPQIKAEMERNLGWLVPMAANTSKMYQGFGWVGEWANTSSDFSNEATTSRSSPIRLQTLYHADKQKMDSHILELMKCLHRLITAVKGRDYELVNSLPVRTANQKTSPIKPPTSTFPLLDGKPLQVKLSQEEMELLERVGKVQSLPIVSKSQKFTSMHRRSFQIRVLCRSSESSPSREAHDDEDYRDLELLNQLHITV